MGNTNDSAQNMDSSSNSRNGWGSPYTQQQQRKQPQQQQQRVMSTIDTRSPFRTGQKGYSEPGRTLKNDADVVDFGEKVVVAYNFWKVNVDKVPRSKQQKLGLLLFSNLFKKQPMVRQLFLNTDISKQSLRLLDMFGWLLKTLVKDKNQMRVRTLKSVGQRHVSYGVHRDYFAPMLDSLNEALLEMYTREFTPKIRIALTLLFRSAGNEMMRYAGASDDELPFGQNSESFNDKKDAYTLKYRFLSSIDHTLADPVGFSALEAFFKKLYCPELTEFHKAYRIYRCCLAPKVRQEIAKEIIKLFLSQNAQMELNDGSENREKIYDTIQRCDLQGADYPLTLFDDTHVWVKFQISQHWIKFKTTVQQR